MAHTRRSPRHPNAALTPVQRVKMARLVVYDGWSATAGAQRFQVTAKLRARRNGICAESLRLRQT